MGDVNLGAVKASLELDASGLDQTTKAAIDALQKMGATAEQTQRVLEEMMKAPAAHRGDFITPLLEAAKATEQWSESQQRAAMRMSGMQAEALKLNAAIDKQNAAIAAAARGEKEWSDAAQRAAMQMSAAHDAALKMNAALGEQNKVLAQGSQGLAAFGDSFGGAIKQGLLFGGAAAAGAAAATMLLRAVKDIPGALFDTVAATAKLSEHLSNLSLTTGLSTDMLQTMGKAAVEAGGSADTFINSIARMEAKLGTGTKQVQSAVAALGLSWKELKNSSPDEAVNSVIASLLKMTDVAERNAIAMKLGFRNFQEALPAMQAYVDAGERYVNLTKAQIAAGKEMDDSLDAVGTAWKELGEQIGAALDTPEMREALKSLASAIRDMALEVKAGTGPISTFFKLISTAAATAAKDIIFLGGALDGLRERMASPTKDTPGLIASGMKALDAYEARVEASKIKAGQKEAKDIWFPNLDKELGPKLGGLGKGAEAEAAAKKIQDTWDGLSGAKAQEQMDLIGAAIRDNSLEGVEDLAGLGKQLVDLASKGAKVPAALLPAIQAFAQKAAMQGVPQMAAKAWDEMTKTAEGNIKKQAALKIKAAKDEEQLAKDNMLAIVAIGKSQTDMLQRQLHDGTLSVHQEYDIRRALIAAQNQEQIDNLEKRRLAATDPSIIAAIDEEIRRWQDLTVKEIEATKQLERYAAMGKLAGQVGQILGGIADVFDAIGISADSAIGKIVGGLQQAAASVQNFAQQTTTVGKISAGLSAAASVYQTGQQKGAAAGVLSGAATGAAIGTMIAPGIGTAIGAVAGIVVGLAGALRKPEFKKIMNDVGKSWGVSISEGLAKEIEGIAKANKISRSLAELLDVSKIIGESGKDPREFTGKINDLMNAIAAGSVPAAQGLAELGRAFNQVADAALKSGNIGDKALVGLIKRARELGEVTPEMKQFIGGQLDSAVEGVKKLLEVMPADTAAKAGSSGALLAATFNAIAAEQGIVAASAALGPAYDSLMGQITKAGLAIPTALQAIGRQVELGKNKEFQAASGAAAATSQVLSGLGNAGYMDTGILTASADVAKQTFDQAKNAGATDKEAYQAIGGLLSDIKNASVQSGQEISGLAQELISGAQAEGVIIQGNQLSVLVDIRNILAGGGYTPSGVGVGGGTGASGTGGGFGGQGSESGGVTGRAADVFTAPPSVPYRERELRHFQGGSHGVQDFGAGTLALLHGREAVHTEKQLSEMGRPSIGFSPTFVNSDPTHTNESRAALSAFQVDDFVRQVINNPLFQQILRDQGLRG